MSRFESFFIEVKNIGRSITGCQWKAGNHILRDGYVGVRGISVDGDPRVGSKSYNVICEIIKSKYGYPFFKCSAYNEAENLVVSVSKSKITSVVNALLKALNLTTKKRWSGTQFFGLTTSVFNKHLKEAEQQVSTRPDSPVVSKNEDLSVSVSETTSAENSVTFLSKHSKVYPWIGVVSYGKATKCYNNGTPLNVGYSSQREVLCHPDTKVLVTCSIDLNKGSDELIFICSSSDHIYKHPQISVAVNSFLKLAGCIGTKHWSGYEFFGLTRKDVQDQIQKPLSKKVTTTTTTKSEQQQILNNVSNILKRNAGPTSALSRKSYIDSRNSSIHNVVDAISFGDVKSYVDYLVANHSDVVLDSINANDEFLRQIKKASKSLSNIKSRDLSVKDSCELLVGRCDLSQREYKSLKNVLLRNNVTIASYENAKRFASDLEIGQIEFMKHTNSVNCGINCMHASTSVVDTLRLIVKTEFTFKQFSFVQKENQVQLFDYLKDFTLYQNLDYSKRTIFLRDTGDNFRATKNYPTEQISFSVLNITKLVNSPHGQFATSLYRGTEKRETLISHGKFHFDELEFLVKNGIVLELPDGTKEFFNVFVFFIADLGYVKEILGKASCMCVYGCYRCVKKIQDWDSKDLTIAKPQSVANYSVLGEKALAEIGENPDKDSVKYKNFIRENLGQWAPPIFTGFILHAMPPCGLHLILAIHRYMWTFLYNVINKRSQDNIISEALRHIQLDYLAYQIESYFNSKKKYYDGSESLKMIGNDCKHLEMNINKFLHKFIRCGETWECTSFMKMRQVSKLYLMFQNIARDIRSVTISEDNLSSFGIRVENFFQSLRTYCGSDTVKRKPYLHILRDHVPQILKFWNSMLGWGYGYFHCSAGEHLNKQMKQLERYGTNSSDDRFVAVLKKIRLRQFHFSESIFQKETDVTCSNCHEKGHNRKNKSCLMHPDQPAIHYPDTDGELE